MEATCPHGRRATRRAWKAAWSQAASLSPCHRAVLEAIYGHLGERLHCWPSQASLAQQAGVSERTIRRRLHDLEAMGWIERREQMSARGRLTDTYAILLPDGCPVDGASSPEPTGQSVRGCPANLSGEKGSEEKASEQSSSAAAGAAAVQGSLSKPSKAPSPQPPAKAPSPLIPPTTPPLPHVAQLLSRWEELVQTPPPDVTWLSHHSGAELETALALLLVRRRSGPVRSPRGLYLRLLAAVHAGERETRRYSAPALRAIAAGVLPEHVRGVPHRDLPEGAHDDDPPPDETPDETPTPPDPAWDFAFQLAHGTSAEQWEEVCRQVLEACASGRTHELVAADALNRVWGLRGGALGMLHQVKAQHAGRAA
jgi:hypothetical protein